MWQLRGSPIWKHGSDHRNPSGSGSSHQDSDFKMPTFNKLDLQQLRAGVFTKKEDDDMIDATDGEQRPSDMNQMVSDLMQLLPKKMMS